MQLKIISRIFEECFHDAAVFTRSSRGVVVETDVVRKDGKPWIVVAAGVEDREAHDCFHHNPGRAERAVEPLSIQPQGHAGLLFIVRPVDITVENGSTLGGIAPFAPGRGIPYVEVRDGSFFRCWDIDDPESHINSLRWEYDIRSSLSEPHESWLKDWKCSLGGNPAHPTSHLHINAQSTGPNSPDYARLQSAPAQLRLEVGVPNPLGMILSVAVWMQRLSFQP